MSASQLDLLETILSIPEQSVSNALIIERINNREEFVADLDDLGRKEQIISPKFQDFVLFSIFTNLHVNSDKLAFQNLDSKFIRTCRLPVLWVMTHRIARAKLSDPFHTDSTRKH